MSNQDDELRAAIEAIRTDTGPFAFAKTDKLLLLIHDREAKAERRGGVMELNLLNDAIEHLEENIDLATGDYYDTHLGGYVEERRIKLAQSEGSEE